MEPPAPTTATLSGTAATGAPFAGATVKVYDRSGALVGTATAGADGTYTVTIPATTPAPLVLEATKDDQMLVSTFAETRTTRVNITPLTNLIAARLAPDGNPRSLRTNAAVVTPAKLEAKVAEVITILKPLLDTIGDKANPLTGEFSANGTGHDKVLDSVSVDIRLAGAKSNIELTVRAASSEPIRTAFTSDATGTPPPLPSGQITKDNLPPDNVAAMIADLTARMTACYALPLSERISGVPSGATAVTGTAASVVAPACRTMFLDDDPATFFSNGGRVGRDSNGNGAFNSLFRSNATGVKFELGQLEFLRNNATHDVVFSYRTTDASGNVNYDTIPARTVNGKLKLVGNGYVYSASVRAFGQDRDYLNQPKASYWSTGYDVNIANRVDGSGNPVFDRVEVTAPNGDKLTYKPVGGRGALSVVYPNGTISGTSVVRLTGRFKDPAATGRPSSLTGDGLFWTSHDYSDDDIRALPEQGVWRLEFFHSDSSQANVVQSYRTVSRAATIDELKATPIADLTAAAKTEIRTMSSATGVITFGPPSASDPNIADLSTDGGGDFWTVPAGAIAPTSVTIFGRGPGPARVPYDDAVNVASTARKTVIRCSVQSNADPHCDNSTGVLQYANGSDVTSLQLFAVTPRIAGIGKMNATYYPLPR
ncbi:carboxypeptidase regulatory-like domain-containing protein [Ramlibacter sp. USB13]|uniref:Carboxypeptidase regulatory-like domain-containing protein n=1 Tax=Ramlibacter cellulosilyticus TaxID=2764187 RepID=A0A923SAM1_9BURK|nr:carboxypeptidase regulatory-like domain-containing protein [Ramlibacter cellulosilyticus]